MKQFKRMLAILLAAIFVFGCFTACGKKAEPEATTAETAESAVETE